MIDMPQVKSIRTMHREGHNITEIAEALKLSRPTVRKYLGMDDFSQPVPQEARRPSKLDPYKGTVMEWLEADRKVWRKQRHTAKRVFERLRDEAGYTGSYALVQRFVKECKESRDPTGFLDLVWEPGSVQADFGQADFHVYGVLSRMHYLVVAFPHSNTGFAQLFRGENAECVCEGLRSVFEYIGGVPSRAVFDNGAGVGKRVSNAVRLTELFSRFQAHYGFEATFCNPDAGHEKGNVENMVGALRRSLFVPVPDICDIGIYNRILLDECMDRSDAFHYRKGQSALSLFQEDLRALSPLPAKPFNCVRYQSCRTDKYGNVTVEGCHRYSTAGGLAGKAVTVAFGAEEVWIHDTTGRLVATHRRLYGHDPGESLDPGASLRLLVSRPGGWKNSSVRMSLPESLKGYIDSQGKEVVRECLSTLLEASSETDYATAVEAAWNVYQHTGRIRRPDVAVWAQRLWYGEEAGYSEMVDLEGYDRAFAGMGVNLG